MRFPWVVSHNNYQSRPSICFTTLLLDLNQNLIRLIPRAEEAEAEAKHWTFPNSIFAQFRHLLVQYSVPALGWLPRKMMTDWKREKKYPPPPLSTSNLPADTPELYLLIGASSSFWWEVKPGGGDELDIYYCGKRRYSKSRNWDMETGKGSHRRCRIGLWLDRKLAAHTSFPGLLLLFWQMG